MALEQFFTLAFALHLEPLPTLDYAAVPYQKDSAEHNDTDDDPASLRVGGNTRLEAIHDRHLPHSIDTLSFVLNYTQAIDAIEPFAKLISMLEQADDSPDFRNLREFFDTRYHPDGHLVGSEKEQTPTRRLFRSSSRAASTQPPRRRGSQTTDGRKQSFATSLGGASGLKLGWRRKNVESQQNQDASDDEDSHSRMSSSGHITLPAPSSAPYIRLLKAPSEHPPTHTTHSPDLTQGSPRPAHTAEYRPTKLVNFTVRLDLHTVGLAPSPPRPRVRNQDVQALKRVGSAKSTSSVEWRRRRQQSQLLGGAALGPVTSPDSIASFGLASPELESANHSGFSRLYEETSATDGSSLKASGLPGDAEVSLQANDAQLSSIDEDAATRDSQLNRVVSGVSSTGKSGSASNKPSRRPSMMSRLLDLGRKKTSADYDSNDSQPATAVAIDASTTRSRPPSSTRQSSFRSGLRQDLAQGNRGMHEEALDLDEEDEGFEQEKVAGKQHKGLFRRRRSSAESSNRLAHGNARSMEPDLRSVQEDGMLDLHRASSRSSVDTSLSGLGAMEDVAGTSISADGGEGLAPRARSNTVREGHDFVTLLRQAASLCLNAMEERYNGLGENPNGSGSDVTTPNPGPPQEESVDSPSLRTPRVYPKKSSVPSTPGKSVKSLDLDRSPAMANQHNPIDANFKLGASLAKKSGEETEAWWPCGDVDPLPISVSSALGQALGWEGIMHLCYGAGSRAANQGDYVALGKAAALDEASKVQEKNVLDWRTGVASAGTSPDRYAQQDSLGDVGSDEVQRLADSIPESMRLNQAPASHMEKLLEQAGRRSSPHAGAGEWQASSSLFGQKVNTSRTWKHWQMLMKSIKGWVDEYESVRVRNGLAREIGLDPTVDDEDSKGDDIDAAQLSRSPDGGSVQVPFNVGSPQSNQVAVFQAPSGKVDAHMVSKVQSASRNIPHCILADATNRRHGFRRRAGIPEGLPLGPEDEETIDYSWSRKKLSVNHFGTAMTISSDSLLHYVSQLGTSEWVHRSAWELDYLEMCVFKTPLVADRFVPPGEAAVPAWRSYHPQEGTADRSKLCPNPDDKGAWDPDTWKRWLSSIREGEIIVPAISWQAWWTLISVLNGADRTGRSYDLQVKTLEEPFEALTDLNAVYL